MKWLIVVVFANIQGDVYIFTDPKFDSYEECYGSITDPQAIPGYARKLVQEYGGLIPIRGINCLSEQKIEQIMSGSKET